MNNINSNLEADLKNPLHKDILSQKIKEQLLRITAEDNLVNLFVDTQKSLDSKIVRVTVFVKNKYSVQLKLRHRVEQSLKKYFGYKFKILFNNADLDKNELIRLSGISGTNSISFIDIENILEIKNNNIEEIFSNLIFKTLNIGRNDNVIICANPWLIKKLNKVLERNKYKDNIIFFNASGKDASDFRIAQIIQKLYTNKKIYRYNSINIVSGDGFFINSSKFLMKKGLNVKIFGRLSSSHFEYKKLSNYVPLSDKCEVIGVL